MYTREKTTKQKVSRNFMTSLMLFTLTMMCCTKPSALQCSSNTLISIHNASKSKINSSQLRQADTADIPSQVCCLLSYYAIKFRMLFSFF